MTEIEIREKVREIMLSNTVQGFSKSAKKHFQYTRPSTRPYLSQYFWDTCFHAFILTALEEHKTAQNYMRYPIPSVAKSDPSFNPTGSLYLWRGPTWIVFNWFIYQFLKDKGYHDKANVLIDCIKKLLEKSGFREYYNPFTGEGYGATNFTWTGLIVDMMNKEKG